MSVDTSQKKQAGRHDRQRYVHVWTLKPDTAPILYQLVAEVTTEYRQRPPIGRNTWAQYPPNWITHEQLTKEFDALVSKTCGQGFLRDENIFWQDWNSRHHKALDIAVNAWMQEVPTVAALYLAALAELIHDLKTSLSREPQIRAALLVSIAQ